MSLFPKKRFFSQQEEAKIIASIQEAEKNTSGEIRVHVESKVGQADVFHRAFEVFEALQMHETQARNGVLIYLAMKDHKFAIVGDEGIDEKVPENFWENIKEEMKNKFARKEFVEGLSQGILRSGEQLKEHFPYTEDDQNELPDTLSQGD